ncbi:MAG: CBS domain-containing protein [Cyclobacteriaceae bacterium]|nr:CBS domain-containing protein [Cyclobacteriaceae bacterium]
MNFKPKLEKKSQQNSGSSEVKAYEPITKYMAKNLITFTADTEIVEVIDTLLEKRISGAPVLNEKKEIIGVIDDKDCLRVLVESVYHNLPIRKRIVDTYMTDVYKTISIDSDIVDVANEFLKSYFKRFLIVNHNGKLMGQISRRDILKAIQSVNRTNWHKQN